MKSPVLTFLFLLCFQALVAQQNQGTRERIQIYSHAIEGNLINDPAERDVTVYLPPSYLSEPEKRFPVLYMLHGYTDSDITWFGWEEHWINLYEVIEAALQEGLSREMIVVMPNAYNSFQGSFYSSSVTIGDWETFVSRELVDYMDAHYRTIAEPSSRGLAGHSMGGYGTIRLAMKYPEVWSSIYILSPCCLDGTMLDFGPDAMKEAEALTKLEQLETANFGALSTYSMASAWSPNPENPPFYLDLPFAGGESLPEIAARFSANRVLYMIGQYIFNLEKLKAIGLDVGDQDPGSNAATKKLHGVLQSYSVPHLYEEYEGDHLNRIPDRIRTRVLPFFSENLVFEE